VGGQPSSTIGFERRFNPMLQPAEDAFVRLTTEPSARPSIMSASLAAHRGEGDDADVDVRAPAECDAGRIPGAISISQAELDLRLAELPRQPALRVACQSGTRSLHPAQVFKGLDHDQVAILEGATSAWIQAGLPVQVETA
jgi:rhodanese-related sulfurtransferase